MWATSRTRWRAKRAGVGCKASCAAIHHAELRDIDGILYANDGDWVESLTALAEHADGSLEILHWAEHMPVEVRVGRTASRREPTHA